MELKRFFTQAIILLSTACGLAPTRADPTTTPSTTFPTTVPVNSEHEITLNARRFYYNATAAQMPLKDDKGKITANIFYVAYEKSADGKTHPATLPTTMPTADPIRPITFIFNGGPGSAAVWLHLGAAGPRRVALPANGFPPSPPYALCDNAESWLDLTDLVFIDPVGTGFSRAEDGEDARQFYSTHGDTESVADFIRLYCTQHNRWLSPKYLAGESYGTTRAAALAEHLHNRFGIDLNGIVLISSVLNFQTISFTPGNDTAYPLYIPTYAAIAHYHKKLSPALQADFARTVAEAKHWAETTYANALTQGSALDDSARAAIVTQLAEFTGLPRAYVERSNLRIDPARFEKQILGEQHKIVGRFDGRVTGDETDPLNDTAESDPSLDAYLGVFSNTINDYLRRELKFETDEPYEVLSPRVNPWDFEAGHGTGGYLDVAPQLARAIVATPSLRVLICCGYYDLATPFASVDATVNAMPLGKSLRGNVTQAYFAAGHMLYLNPNARIELKARLTDFYQMH